MLDATNSRGDGRVATNSRGDGRVATNSCGDGRVATNSRRDGRGGGASVCGDESERRERSRGPTRARRRCPCRVVAF